MKEQSHLDAMRAAVRGDRERAEQARRRPLENVLARVEEPVEQPRPEAAPPRRRALGRLFGRR